MKITEIDVWNFSPTFRDGPYVMSHVTQTAAQGRLLSVHTSDGARGSGEIVFAPSLRAEERQQRIEDERDYLASLIGLEVGALAALAAEARERGKSWRAIAFGLETAYFDIQARFQDRSFADLLGGALGDATDDYFSISERSVERIRDRLAIAGPDRTVIQLKLGTGSQAEDAANVAATLDAMTGEQTLLADANGAWSIAEALDLIARFDDARLIWEEPCTAYADNVTVARGSRKPVMLDQCVGDRDTAIKAVNEPIAAAICIKPAFLGGLSVAREIRDLCVSSGMRMRIDGPWCGDIATAAILSLAVGAPPDLLVAGCDLREPLNIQPGLSGVVTLDDGRIAPRPGPGLGVEAIGKTLGEPDAVYR